MTDKALLHELVEKYEVTSIHHLASLLSAVGEQDPDLTWDTNLGSLKHVLDIAREKKLRVFWPSSIAVFGPTTPRDNTPQHTILEPTTMYGVSKLAGEALCSYYHRRFGVDVRSLRYPGIISWKTEPGGGTTDYAVAIYIDAVKRNSYECFLGEDSVLPMMYMDDAIEATMMLLDAPRERLTVNTSYNLAAISFTPKQLADCIAKRCAGFTISYKIDPLRQSIANSWPRVIDDSAARSDWGWQHKFDMERMTDEMLKNLK